MKIPFFFITIHGVQSESGKKLGATKFSAKRNKDCVVSKRDLGCFFKANIIKAKKDKAHVETLKKISALASKVVSFSGVIYQDKFCFNPKVRVSFSEFAGFIVYGPEKRKLDGKADSEIQEVFFDFSKKVFEAKALMQCVNSVEATLRSVRSEFAELCKVNGLKSRIDSISESLDEMKADLCDLRDELKAAWGADLFGGEISLSEVFNGLKENNDISLFDGSKDFDTDVASANRIYAMLTILDFAYDYDIKGTKGSLAVSLKPFKLLEIFGSKEADALRVESGYDKAKLFYEQRKLYRKIKKQFLKVDGMSKELCGLEVILKGRLSASQCLETSIRFMELKISYTKAAIDLFKDIALYKKNNNDLINHKQNESER